jgi:hypothetical protein
MKPSGWCSTHTDRSALIVAALAARHSGGSLKRLYERRVVAFVDILGFGDIVARTTSDPSLFREVRDVLKLILHQEQLIQAHRQRLMDKERARRHSGLSIRLLPASRAEMTAFSDCYLVSDKIKSGWHVPVTAQALAATLLSRGILCRGSVVLGDAYHRDRVLFGPAVIAAYRLEKDVAKYPRIIVSDDAAERFATLNESTFDGHLLRRDVDGCWFLNSLAPPLSRWSALTTQADEIRNAQNYLKNVRRHLVTRLRETRRATTVNLDHLTKVRWLASRFNQEIKKRGIDIRLIQWR